MTHYYQSLLDTPASFKDIKCEAPDIAADKPLADVPDENLICANSTEPSESDLAILSDLNFREIFL